MKKYRKKKKCTIWDYLLYITLFALLGAFIFIYYFNKSLGPGLIECAENEMERLTILVMNNSLEKYLADHTIDPVLIVSRNDNNEIERIQYDTKVMNQITSDVVSILETDLYYLSKGEFEKLDFGLKNVTDDYYEMFSEGILFTVSMGSATGNQLLSNIGPKVPLNLNIVGDVVAEIETEVTEYGLNNALVEVFIQVEVNTVIHMPFLSKKVKVMNKIPLTMEMIQGKVPDYFFSNS